MKYGLIKYGDELNGDGISVSIFVSGCDFFCKNCFNKEAQDKNYGYDFDEKVKFKIYKYFEDNFKYLDNLCILGGDPMMEYNYKEVLNFVIEFKSKFPSKKIIIWTGYLFEYLIENRRDILNYIDILCDGQFIEELYDKNLKWVGSSNQKVVDVKKSLKENKIILFENII
jgi:anaerobic ribonucleoside-triphosphate reductase activating protein